MKTRNFVLYAVGLAAAITFGGAETASAQATPQAKPQKKTVVRKKTVKKPIRAKSQQVIPVRKEPLVAARVDTIRIVQVETVTVRSRPDTVTIRMRPDTVVQMQVLPLNRLAETFFGFGGGALIPANHFNDFAKRGYDLQAQLGHYFSDSPFGVRIDGNYGWAANRETTCPSCSSTKVMTGDADLLFRMPLDRKSHLNPILYALAGGNITKFSDFLAFRNEQGNIVTAGLGNTQPLPIPKTVLGYPTGDKSLFYGYNVGGGIEVDVAGAHMFVETKYMTVSTVNGNTHYFPLVIGFNFY